MMRTPSSLNWLIALPTFRCFSGERSEGYDRYVSEVREYFKDRDDLLEVDFITGESTPKEVYKFLNIVNYVPPSKFITTNVGLEQAKVWQRKRNESSRNKTKG